MISKVSKVFDYSAIASGIVLFLLAVLTFCDVFGRRFLNSPVTGTIELVEIRMALVAILAMPTALYLNSNVTADFLAIRPSGNPITAEALVGMYSNADLVVELSELVKIHRLEANSDWGFSAFTLKEAFNYKGEQNNDLSSYSMIFKKVDGTWKISWMQRSSGNTDLSTWD